MMEVENLPDGPDAQHVWVRITITSMIFHRVSRNGQEDIRFEALTYQPH